MEAERRDLVIGVNLETRWGWINLSQANELEQLLTANYGPKFDRWKMIQLSDRERKNTSVTHLIFFKDSEDAVHFVLSHPEYRVSQS